ncbi:hypothetical protein FACS1894137_16800 [Spirochaetia bacterium]|nr:hypothetical protein FACS1894137_16800 [Spirochaetia bacterium]
MGAMATTLGGITLGMVIANKPKAPHFADGGIVPGRKSDGDTIPVMATAGEIIMNEMQQERVADGIVGGKNITLDATFILDSETIGKATFNWANDTGAVLKARAIIG